MAKNCEQILTLSAGAQFGGAFQLNIDKGVFVFDIAVIFGGRIEINWGKRDEK
ncbi:MAG: hypothetical protein SO116_06375 [Treponema sp.]|nr:hypothetical protein [Spirochaetales bacterium]MDY4902483.1 hypothetical protein [Treponema sp.]